MECIPDWLSDELTVKFANPDLMKPYWLLSGQTMLAKGLEESNVTLTFEDILLPKMSLTSQEITPLLVRFVIESVEIWPPVPLQDRSIDSSIVPTPAEHVKLEWALIQ